MPCQYPRGEEAGEGELGRVPIRITVSYRRSDSPYASRGIRARLAEHFGKENVFMDIDSIALGVDYRKPIAEALAKTDVVAVVIGPKWFGQREGGKPRLFDSNDPVRYEVAAALSAERILVIPLLVDGATMPGEEELPENLKELAYRNATQIDSGRDFEAHVDRVIRSIEYWQRDEFDENQRLAPEDRQGRQSVEEAERQREAAHETERRRLTAPTQLSVDAAEAVPGQLAPQESERQPPAPDNDVVSRQTEHPAAQEIEHRQGATEAPRPSASPSSGRTHWWILFGRGLLVIVFGFALSNWPFNGYYYFGVGYYIRVFESFVLADGAMTIVQGLPIAHSGTARRGYAVAQGAVGIFIGLLALAFSDVTRTTLVHLIVIWAAFTGVLEIAAAIRLRRSLPNEFPYAFGHGVFSVALGTLVGVFSFPALGALRIYALVSGIGLMVALAFRRRTS